MKKPQVEDIIKDAVAFLSEFFPQKTYLFFPLLTAFFVWALRSAKDWQKKILSWQVWLEPEYLEAKPDEFVLDFFRSHRALQKAYQHEIDTREMASLRKAFRRLYPILGLEDPFLSALFDRELEKGDYKKIVRDFEEKVSQAQKDLQSVQEERLMERFNSLAHEVLSLNLELISQPKLRRIIADLVKKHTNKADE
ncbi:MAG: hypothetical protein ACLFVG_05115 [Candidatus Aminicenantes bacterium]